MNLVIFTEGYPYGNGEAFLENEVGFAAGQFEKILVVSLNRYNTMTRTPPDNFLVARIDRYFFPVKCALYAFGNIFSGEARCEYSNVKRLESKPPLIQMVKSWFVYWMTEKRISLFFSNNKQINTKEYIGYSYWCNRSAYYLAKHRDEWGKIITRVHAFEIRDKESYIPFRRIVDDTMDGMFFISEYTLAEYQRIMQSILHRSCNAKNKYLSRLGVVKSEGCEDLPEPENTEFTIVSCSSIIALKRLDLIVDALAELHPSTVVRWIHFGDGADYEKIKQYAADKLNSTENIKYSFMGHVQNQTVKEYYRDNLVDVFINTSDIEGIPVSIMEAMSFGIPVIARNVGGNSEIVKTGENGFLLEKEADAQKLTTAVTELIRAKKQGEILFDKKKIIQFISQYYDAEKNYTWFYKTMVEDIGTA